MGNNIQTETKNTITYVLLNQNDFNILNLSHIMSGENCLIQLKNLFKLS